MSQLESIRPAVSAFLAQKPIPHYINNQPVLAADGRTHAVLDPATGKTLATISLGGAGEIKRAVDAASAAFPSWAAMPANERAVLLHRWADLMEKHAADLAQIESLDVGKTIGAAESGDIPMSIQCLRYFADHSVQAQYGIPLAIKNMEARVHRAPYGVCGFIFPWNFPFLLFAWGIMPALAAGNTVVVKPSEVTPLSSHFAAQLAIEAGIPAGVVNVVTGLGSETGPALTEHPAVRRMSFTGSPEVGRIISEACGRRLIPCKLELGGKGAAVVFDDVDVAGTAEKLAGAITGNTGQICCTATRWIIHENVAKSFKDAVVAVLKKTKIGPGLDRETTMGPLVSQAQLDRVAGYFEKGKAGGANIVLDCKKVGTGGFFLTPWLLEGKPDNVCFREEIFGPTAFITTFREEQEALDMIHSVDYGLANSVWSADLTRANRIAQNMVVGNSWINAHNVFAYGLPYGGVNRSGMGGGVNYPGTFNDYLREQTIARPL
jgi:acyl-CoA reductase-like NAD-dependent aldehyde dehydrogenase